MRSTCELRVDRAVALDRDPERHVDRIAVVEHVGVDREVVDPQEVRLRVDPDVLIRRDAVQLHGGVAPEIAFGGVHHRGGAAREDDLGRLRRVGEVLLEGERLRLGRRGEVHVEVREQAVADVGVARVDVERAPDGRLRAVWWRTSTSDATMRRSNKCGIVDSLRSSGDRDLSRDLARAATLRSAATRPQRDTASATTSAPTESRSAPDTPRSASAPSPRRGPRATGRSVCRPCLSAAFAARNARIRRSASAVYSIPKCS